MRITKNILCVLLVMFTGTCFGQQNIVDDLKHRLERESGSERIETLLQLSSHLDSENTQAALIYTEEALDLSRAYRNDSLEAESIYMLGSIYQYSGAFIESIEQMKTAESLFSELGLDQRMINAKSILGSVYSDAGNYPQALKYYFEVLEYGREQLNVNTEVFALTRIAVIQSKLGELSIARRFFQEAIDKAVESGNWGAQTIALSELAAMERTEGNLDLAIRYYQQSIDIFNERNVVHAVPRLLYNIAELQSESADYSLAIETAERAIEGANSMNNSFLTINAIILLSHIYHLSGDYSKSNELLQEASTSMQNSSLMIFEIQISELMAKNYAAMGNESEAIRLNSKSLSAALEQKKWTSAQKALSELVKLQEQTSNFKEALNFQKLLVAVNDSILNAERNREIVELETRFNLGEQERQIQLLEKEKEKQAFIQYALAAGLVLFMIGGFLLFRIQKHKAQKQKIALENVQLREEKLQSELEYKNKQLTTQSLNLVQKNELMKELKGKINNLGKEVSARDLGGLTSMVDYSLSLDKDWEQFQLHFEEVHASFYHFLKENYPDMTPNDMKLCALVKLNLSIKEMAAILGISSDSVKTARYRLRKKLNLNTEQNLTDFMLELERRAIQYSD